MELEVLDKILGLISSDDPEMVELGKNIFVENNPQVRDYLYLEEAVKLKTTDPRGFINSVERRLKNDYDIFRTHVTTPAFVKDPNKTLKLKPNPLEND